MTGGAIVIASLVPVVLDAGAAALVVVVFLVPALLFLLAGAALVTEGSDTAALVAPQVELGMVVGSKVVVDKGWVHSEWSKNDIICGNIVPIFSVVLFAIVNKPQSFFLHSC